VIEHPDEETRLDGKAILLGAKQIQDGHWAPGAPPATERQKAFLAIWDRLRTRTSEGLALALDELAGAIDRDPGDPMKRPMTVEDAKSVPAPIELGSHALTHRSLRALSSADKVQEIAESKRRCEAIAGSPVPSFAFPFGDADAECIRLVKSAGFECACITGERAVAPGTNVYALPRIGVGNFGAGGLARLLGDT
jgi:peptidoglycan/xylan/chitin deacetylase (PgdA/CDA1 family)